MTRSESNTKKDFNVQSNDSAIKEVINSDAIISVLNDIPNSLLRTAALEKYNKAEETLIASAKTPSPESEQLGAQRQKYIDTLISLAIKHKVINELSGAMTNFKMEDLVRASAAPSNLDEIDKTRKNAEKTLGPLYSNDIENTVHEIIAYDFIVAALNTIPDSKTKELTKNMVAKAEKQLMRHIITDGNVDAALKAFVQTYKTARALGKLPEALDDMILKNSKIPSFEMNSETAQTTPEV